MEIKKIKLKAFLALAVMSLFLTGLFACGGEVTKGPAEKPKEEAKPPAEELEEEKMSKLLWSYDPTGKRDPFKVPTPPETPSIGPCSGNYYLDQMWINGIIIGGGDKNVAHIILPNQKDCFVKVGDVLGANKGIVQEIRSDGIIVQEKFLDPVDPTKIRIVDKFLKMETESETQVRKK